MSIPITYVPDFLSASLADRFFNELWNDLAWVRHDRVPRREYYYNDVAVPYTYGVGAGVRTYQPQPLHSAITEIRYRAEDHAGCKFEVCFLNGYENQKDQLGWHADDSPEMDDARPIAIVSLGFEREIWFCPQENKTDQTHVLLGHGSICLMQPGMQDTHFHRIPKSPIQSALPRISLTFRGFVE